VSTTSARTVPSTGVQIAQSTGHRLPFTLLDRTRSVAPPHVVGAHRSPAPGRATLWQPRFDRAVRIAMNILGYPDGLCK
jgi:hypothetical protein